MAIINGFVQTAGHIAVCQHKEAIELQNNFLAPVLILPGLIDTGMYSEIDCDEDEMVLVEQIAFIGRYGAPSLFGRIQERFFRNGFGREPLEIDFHTVSSTM